MNNYQSLNQILTHFFPLFCCMWAQTNQIICEISIVLSLICIKLSMPKLHHQWLLLLMLTEIVHSQIPKVSL